MRKESTGRFRKAFEKVGLGAMMLLSSHDVSKQTKANAATQEMHSAQETDQEVAAQKIVELQKKIQTLQLSGGNNSEPVAPKQDSNGSPEDSPAAVNDETDEGEDLSVELARLEKCRLAQEALDAYFKEHDIKGVKYDPNTNSLGGSLRIDFDETDKNSGSVRIHFADDGSFTIEHANNAAIPKKTVSSYNELGEWIVKQEQLYQRFEQVQKQEQEAEDRGETYDHKANIEAINDYAKSLGLGKMFINN